MTDSTKSFSLGQLIARSKTEEESGDIINARKSLELALVKAEQYGTSSFTLEQTLETIAQFFVRRGMHEHAIKHWERLIDARKKRLGADNPQLLPLLDHLAACHRHLDAHRALEPVLRDAVRLAEQLGEDKEKLVVRLERFADTLAILQKMDESHAVRKRAKELQPPAKQRTAPLPTAQPPAAPLVAERRVFLGQLLMRSQLIVYAELNKQLQIAKRLGLPIGEVLVSSGLLTDDSLQAALKLQALTRENVVTLDQAAAVLRRVAIDGVPLSEALPQTDPGSQFPDSKLGSLLIEAGFLDEERLRKALEERSQNPLGKQLVLSRVVSAHIVAEALDLQERIREGTISRADAVAQLKKARG